MNIKGGALEFDIIANNGQINSALEETKKRVQGFSDATVEGGAKMEAAYQEAAATIEKAFKEIDVMADIHSTAINELEKEYARLGEAAGQAFQKGTAKGDEEYRALTQKQQAVQAEINQRKELLQEIGTTADALLKEEQTLNTNREKVEQNTKAKGMLRTQIMQLKNELAEAEQAGKRNTDEYRAMQAELGRLTDAMGDANTQAKIMADDYRNMNTVIEVISGITGAFSAAQGAVGLFAGENENLQKIMLKVQSLMSITIGLQQVSKILNKDSYTQMVLVRRAKELLTVAETKFAVALGISNIAAKALMATLTLGISVAITAIVVLLDRFITKNREAQKAQEEFSQKVSDTAASSISSFNALSYAWGELGDNLEAKQKFVEQNTDKFKDLGFSINTVKQAEDLLIANSSKFVEALMLRAKATATSELAVEQYKKVIEAQNKLDKTPKAYVSKKGEYTDGYGVKREGTVLEKSSNWKEAEDALKKAQGAYESLIKQQAEFTTKEKEILASIGADSEEITEGSIKALEDKISKLRKKYKEAANDKERQSYLSQIQTNENLLSKMDKSKSSSKSDPYTELLANRKKQYTQYYKWVSSKDEIIQKAAKTEFAGLLAEGNSYLDYLKNQRDKLLEVAKRSPEQNKKLSKLNDEIANETKNTVLGEFEKELQNQMKGARSIMEMLNILEEKRKALAGDGSEIDNGKKEILDKEQEGVGKKAESETKGLLEKYSAYLSEKLNFDVNYLENKRLLTENLAKATTDEERRIALAALKGLEKDKEKYSKQTGNSDYDGLVEEYKSYQQKCADIAADYDEKIAIASENKNEELVTKLTEAKNKALSSAALEELQNSGAWEKLFGNLDDLTTQQLDSLIAKVEAQRLQLGIELDPKDLEVVFSNLEKAKNELRERNPFKALKNAIKDYNKEVDDTKKKDALKDIFKGAASSIQLISTSFDAVVGGLNDMGLAGDEVTQQLLGDIGEMLGSAGQLAEGIATMNPVSMIQGGIGLITSAFKVFNVHDRKAERAIQKHAAAVKDLETAYKALEHSVKSALGETVYDNQKALINNMRQQQQHLAAMAREEAGKKKSDQGKIDEYKEQYAELGRQIEDTIAEIAQSITQTTAKDLANQLADALVEAYGKGEDAATAFEEVSKQVMQNAVKNALKLQFLEKPLQNAIKQLQRDMGFDDEGNGSFDGLTQTEQNRFKNAVAAIGANFSEAMKMYEGLFKDLEESTDPTTSLSGAIKGASQESIDLLAGQTNAVRVNQVESIEILRQQLIHLASMDAKIGVSNKHLESIDNKIGKDYDPLRSQGLI